MCDDARNKGITGVPVIIIDGKWAISGGQSSDVFVQVGFFFNCLGFKWPVFQVLLQIFKKLAAAPEEM
jgi:hypothetical protein